MSMIITGATGQLGRLVIDNLLATGTPPGQIVAVGRDQAKLDALSQELGVLARPADLSVPQSLPDAFEGVERLLLVSTSNVGQRLTQHRNAIDAANAAGAQLVVYTSGLNAPTARMRMAEEHRGTEEYLTASGVPFIILRNGWYLENYTDQLPTILQHGALLGAAGTGRVSAATRADLAAAAAAVLTEDGHTGASYQLGGEAFTLPQLAQTISQISELEIAYQNLPVEQYAKVLIQAGLPEQLAAIVADADQGLERGELYTDRDDLADLIGHRPTSPSDAIRDAFARLPAST